MRAIDAFRRLRLEHLRIAERDHGGAVGGGPLLRRTDVGFEAEGLGLREAEAVHERDGAAGLGGAAKGEALNVTCSGLTNGGGTLYYTVELDLGDMHYKVTVDAIDGKVISGDATHMGVTNPIDENGDVMDASALPEK